MNETERQAWESAREATRRRGREEGREEGFYEGVENVDSFKRQMTELLEQMQQLIAGLGTPQEGSVATEEMTSSDGPVFEFKVKKSRDFEHGIQARMVIRGGKYVILKGSQSRGKWWGKAKRPEGMVDAFLDMHKDGTLEQHPEKEDIYRFTRDCSFDYSSQAGQFVYGSAFGGPDRWEEIGTGKTLKQWEKENHEELSSQRYWSRRDRGRGADGGVRT